MKTYAFCKTLTQTIFISLLVVLTLNPAHAQRGEVSSADGGSDAIARFLMNFGRFIDWPDSAFSSADSALRVCVLGENQLGRSLGQIVDGKKAGGRTMSVSDVPGSAVADAKNCQIVFVSASETARAAEIASSLEGAPVLTVSEIGDFTNHGGMIGLSGQRGDAVAIRMNRSRIEGAGLNVREQLMRAISQ